MMGLDPTTNYDSGAHEPIGMLPEPETSIEPLSRNSRFVDKLFWLIHRWKLTDNPLIWNNMAIFLNLKGPRSLPTKDVGNLRVKSFINQHTCFVVGTHLR